MKKIYLIALSFLALAPLTPTYSMGNGPSTGAAMEVEEEQPCPFLSAFNAVSAIDLRSGPLYLDEITFGANWNHSAINLLLRALTEVHGPHLYMGPGRPNPSMAPGDDSDEEDDTVFNRAINVAANGLIGGLYWFFTPPNGTEDAHFTPLPVQNTAINPAELGDIPQGQYTVHRSSILQAFFKLWARSTETPIQIIRLDDQNVMYLVGQRGTLQADDHRGSKRPAEDQDGNDETSKRPIR